MNKTVLAEGKKEILAATALVLFCLVAYAGVLKGGFVYTDRKMVFGSLMKKAGQGGGGDAYSGKAPAGGAEDLGWTPRRLPLSQLSYRLAGRFFGDSPHGFHLISIIALAISACLVFALFRRVAASPRADWRLGVLFPAAGALFFCCHPVAAGAAAWISAQKDVLAGLFLLLSALLYFRDSAAQKQSVTLGYAGSIFFYMCACSTDGKAVLWPLVYVVQARFADGEGGGAKSAAARAAKLFPFLAASVFFGVIFAGGGGYGWPGAAGKFGFADIGCAAGVYVRDSVLPFGLGPVVAGAFPVAGAGRAALTAFGWFALVFPVLFLIYSIAAKKFCAWGLAAAWAVAALAPQVFESRDYMADHRSFMLAAGAGLVFCLVVRALVVGRVANSDSFAAAGGGGRQRSIRAAVFLSAALIFIIFMFAGSLGQVRSFASGPAFWSEVVKRNPAEAPAWYLKGVEDAEGGRGKDAEKSFKKAIALDPKNNSYKVGFAKFYMFWKRFSDAEAQLVPAFKTAPGDDALYDTLVNLYYYWGVQEIKDKKYDDAEKHIYESIRLSPRDVYSHTARSTAFYKMGKYQEAYTELLIALALDPDNEDVKWALKMILKEAAGKDVGLATYGVTDDFFKQLKDYEKEPGKKK